METPEYRRILTLYLGGFLKQHNFRRRSIIREHVLYNALYREQAAGYIKESAKPLANLLPHIGSTGYKKLSEDIRLKQNIAFSLYTHDVKQLEKLNKKSKKSSIDLLVKKYNLFKKLGII